MVREKSIKAKYQFGNFERTENFIIGQWDTWM